METLQPFEGFCEIELRDSTHFIETEEEPTSFTVWFYKRDSENVRLEEFLEQLKPNNFGWDEVSQQLFFNSKDNQLHTVSFTKL